MRFWTTIPRQLAPVFALLAFLWTGATTPSTAATNRCDEVVRAALSHDHAIRIAREEEHIADARRDQADARNWPSLDLNGRYFRYSGLNDLDLTPIGLGSLNAIENRQAASIGLTQPLWTGGRLSSQSAATAILADAARAATGRAISDLRLRAQQTYWSWAKAHYLVAALHDGVTRMEAHHQDMQNLMKAGIVTEHEALSTEVLLEQMRLQEKNAIRHTEIGRARIAQLTGHLLPPDAVPETPPAAPALPTDFRNDGRSRPEWRQRTAESRAATERIREEQSDCLPQLTLSARYEYQNPNLLNFPPKDEWQEDAFAGITLSWSLLDWGLTRGRVREQTARAAQAKARLDQTAETIALDLAEARIGVEGLRDALAVAERVEANAARNLAAVTSSWSSGLARHAELLDAHAQLTRAQSDLIAARADLVIAIATWEHATGTTPSPKHD